MSRTLNLRINGVLTPLIIKETRLQDILEVIIGNMSLLVDRDIEFSELISEIEGVV